MRHLITISLVIFAVACSRTTEMTIRKWPDGQKKVTYKIFSGDTLNLVDIFYKAYYPNKQIFKSGQIKQGKEAGLWNYYYQSGKIKSKGNYKDGVLDGDFEAYYESGEIEQKGKYSHGKIISEQLLNRDGTIKPIDENLTKYLLDNPQKWTSAQIEEIRIDCLMVMEPNFDNADNFCICILNLLQKYCNYSDIKQLTDNQRGIILNYVTNNQKYCFNLLDRRKNYR